MAKKLYLTILLLLLPFTLTGCTTGDYEATSSYEESSGYEEYGCTQDCSGHNAGWEWAEDKGITDPSDCGGKSQSFIEGCESYAEEN
ncbi:MAG: hypothetical protein UV26_C0016G0006 [candidate division WWE3 bacterium GW2011_GWF2_42_42]|uniref:Uncharacterized protein n=1 Tax=candidate division WWE3 bacterium GW2011_GWF2_42_42 TaxID=1619142 RepID=A0A0G1CM98_UNCKA|nr:MAG: hypothetical protein UV26_C0016G0006 [candidate division WWE3 bacterium GW2011_GWF2_42_42]